MTVAELAVGLAALINDGKGDRVVRMGDPASGESCEVTGIWIPDGDPVVDLEAGAWTAARRAAVLAR